jgi:carboxyl-terminal processing protease
MKRSIIFIIAISLSFSVFADNDKKVWKIMANIGDIGYLDFYMLTGKSDTTLYLKSPKNRDKKLLGIFRSTILRVMQNRKDKNSIVTIELKENGLIHFLTMKLKIRDIQYLSNDSIRGSIVLTDSDHTIGTIIAKKMQISFNQLQKIRDYDKIIENIDAVTTTNIYNPKLTETKKWNNFLYKFKGKSQDINDDLEFFILFLVNARNVGFSHFYVTRANINLEKTSDDNQLEAIAKNDSVVYIKIKTLAGRLNEIDSIFGSYQNFKYKILDFRNMPGGVLRNAYTLASYLIADTINAGCFVTRRCYLDRECYKNLSYSEKFMTLEDVKTDAFTEMLRRQPGININLFPDKSVKVPVDQQIYILTNNRTASAGEPLVYGLKKFGNALIVGEKTAGQILSPDVFDIGDGYYLVLPIAEYITSDGENMEGGGIEPDIKVKSDKALDWVYKKLNL